MKQEELFTMALGLQDPWFVTKIEFVSQDNKLINELHIQVDHEPLQRFSIKGEEYPVYDHVERTWRHLNFFQHECYLPVFRFATPRISSNIAAICKLLIIYIVNKSPVNFISK